MKKTTKIIAAMVAFLLIIGLLLFVNAWVGNPVSKKISVTSAEKYVAQQYSEMDLIPEKSIYNFKFGSYMVFFRSPTSYDTAFSVYVDSFGNIVRDDYEYEVANNFITMRRLDADLRALGNEIMTKNLNYDISHAIFLFASVGNENLLEKLTRDMAFDITNFPFPICASLTINDTDVSYEKLAEVLKAVATVCNDHGIPIAEYSIYIENNALIATDKNGDEARENKKIGFYNIPAQMLSAQNLVSELKALATQ